MSNSTRSTIRAARNSGLPNESPSCCSHNTVGAVHNGANNTADVVVVVVVVLVVVLLLSEVDNVDDGIVHASADVVVVMIGIDVSFVDVSWLRLEGGDDG